MKRLVYILFILFIYSCQEKTLLKPIQTQIPLDSLAISEVRFDSLIKPYKQQLDLAMNQVIGYAPKTLKNHINRGETTLGNFVSDLMFVQAQKLTKDSVHLALINTHGGLRVPISEGEIKVRDIYEMMPFDNEVYLLKLSGKEVIKVFHHTASDCKNSIYPATFEIEHKKAKSIRVNQQKVDTNKMYNLAISDYLANGGGGFDFLQSVERMPLGMKLRDMIILHIEELTEEGKSVSAELEDRIIVGNNVQ